MEYPWHLYFMGVIYVAAGINHFIKPNIYLRMMPRYLPFPKTLVYLSGLAEIGLGVGACFPLSKNCALWGIIVLLLVFLLVHSYMLKNKKTGMGLPKWILILRFIFQFVLIWWAWQYLKL